MEVHIELIGDVAVTKRHLHFFFLHTCTGNQQSCLQENTRQISLHVQRRIRVDVGHVFGVKTNPYLKIKYTLELFHQPAVKI